MNKKIRRLLSAAIVITSASEAGAVIYKISGSFNLEVLTWNIPVVINSGFYDTEGGHDGTGGGEWNLTVYLEEGGISGGGIVTYDEAFDIDATTGIGWFEGRSNCTSTVEGVCGGGGSFSGWLQVEPVPIGPGPQVWRYITGFPLEYRPVLTEVPVPAAAWLFGSALLGLISMARCLAGPGRKVPAKIIADQ